AALPAMAVPLAALPAMAVPLAALPAMAVPLAALPAMAVPLAAAPAVAVPAHAAAACVSAAAATYSHTLDGEAGTATITATTPLCSGQSQTFALASYTAGAPTSNARPFVFSTDRGSITAAKRSLSLKVAVPGCYTQVETIKGTTLAYEGSNAPGDTLDSYRGGSKDCSPAPTVTFDNSCDGSFTATLANSDRAGTDAVFLTGDRLLRLAPGTSKKVTARSPSTLTVRTSTFTTYTGTWRQPTTCAAVPAPTTSPAAPSAASSPTGASPGGSPSGGSGAGGPASTPAASTTADLSDTSDWYPATPAPTATDTTAMSDSGLSTGSILAIAFGLLLMVGGGFLLVRVLRTLRDEP
ncbi:hypothetical protein, partial [Paractinoplanes deccanensis]